MMITVPTGMPVSSLTPVWKTSHGRRAQVGIDQQSDAEPEHRQPGHAPGDSLDAARSVGMKRCTPAR